MKTGKLENLTLHIEAIIFSSEAPVKVEEIQEALQKTNGEESVIETEAILNSIEEITAKYYPATYAFELLKAGGGYQFLTKSDYHATISNFLNTKSKKRLSSAAMETLSIIAYKQPVTKTDIEQIRGVNSDYTVNKLLEKDLIEIAGRKEAPGTPILYEVSQTFMDYFGINSMDELPKLRDIQPQIENTVGEAPSIEEDAEPKVMPATNGEASEEDAAEVPTEEVIEEAMEQVDERIDEADEPAAESTESSGEEE